jgi:predicted nuclease of predicted toxin-antitoxin system
VLAFLADENFDGDIVAGVRRQAPQSDIVRVQDVGLARADNPVILAWAAEAGRLLLTHDVATVTRDA